MVIISQSTKDTRDFARSVAKQFKSQGGIIALIGDLGSGKTTFTQGFAQALKIKEKITSPTFTLIRQHPIPNSERTLYHIDLYRLETINADELGLTDLFHQKADITLIEWAEKLGDKLPKEAMVIKFKHVDENKRQIVLKD